jgi:hypothetical protein
MALDHVQIQLDKQRKLLFDLNALCELEEQTGKDLDQIFDAMTARNLRLFLWAGLVWDDAELTLEKTGGLVNMTNLKYVTDKVGEALAKAVPDGGPEGNPRSPSRGTGTKPNKQPTS